MVTSRDQVHSTDNLLIIVMSSLLINLPVVMIMSE